MTSIEHYRLARYRLGQSISALVEARVVLEDMPRMPERTREIYDRIAQMIVEIRREILTLHLESDGLELAEGLR